MNSSNLIPTTAQPTSVAANQACNPAAANVGVYEQLCQTPKFEVAAGDLATGLDLVVEAAARYEAVVQGLLDPWAPTADQNGVLRSALLTEVDAVGRLTRSITRQAQAWHKHVDRLSGKAQTVKLARTGKRGIAHERITYVVQNDEITILTPTSDGSRAHKITVPLATFRQVVEAAAVCGSKRNGSDRAKVVCKVKKLIVETTTYKRSSRSVVWAVVNLAIKHGLLTQCESIRRFRLATDVTLQDVCGWVSSLAQDNSVPTASAA